MFVRKPKYLFPACAIFAPRGRQRKQLEGRYYPPVLLRVRAECFGSVCNRFEELFKRRNQMRLVEHYERVRAKQTRMIGPHLARYTITREQESRADHINSTDDDGWLSRIRKPLPIVHMLATQRTHAQFGVV